MDVSTRPDDGRRTRTGLWSRWSADGRARLAWCGVGLLVFLLGAAWAASLPVMAAPDEPSHVFHAAALARGQWDGELGVSATDASRPGAATTVELPTDFHDAAALPNCFAFHPENSAACQQDLAPPVEGVQAPVETFAGQYPPLYYLLVGWSSLWLDAEAAVYGMRLVGAALAAGFLTWGAYRFSRTVGRRWATWAAVTAVTPMCLFLGGAVNPQGLEVAAAVSFWAACLALTLGPSPAGTAVYVQAAVSGAVLVNARAASPVWAVAILVVALLAAPRGRWRDVVRHRAARWVGGGAAVASAAAIGWVATHPVIVAGAEELYPEYANIPRTVVAAMSHTFEYFLNMVGNFGWLDAPAPTLTELAWVGLGAALLLLAVVARAPWRGRAALLLLCAGVVLAPVALQLATAPTTGLIWQGRYGLPLAVGMPLLAAAVLTAERPDAQALLLRLGRLAVPVLAAAHVAAFWWAARRYAEGLSGDVVTFSPEWSSPIGYLTGVAAYGAVVAALTWVAWRALRPTADALSATDTALATDTDAAPAPTEPTEAASAPATS